jgi:hypothetical protein
MGNEANTTVHFGRRQLSGTLLLETTELLFRPADGSPRIKISFSSIRSARAVDGELHLATTDGLVWFDLGEIAEKWCHKILHPKTRAEKLGLKSEAKISLLGEFDPEFLQELRSTTKNIQEGKFDPATELIFLSVDSSKQLASAIHKAVKSLRGATAFWIVYPKGKREITENDVLSAGRKAGLKDVKVVGFSGTHTALKFVLPLERR